MIWLIVFGLCFLIELIWRRGYALWLAMLAGFNALVLPHISWKITLPTFMVLGGATLVLWHFYYRRPLQYHEQHPEERKARDYLHKTWQLSSGIQKGAGKILIDDSIWHLKCDQDLPAGAWVKVSKIQGIFLHVTSVSNVY